MQTPTAVPSLPLPIVQVGDDFVTLVGDHLAHVTSRSHPGMLHSVTDYRCSCQSFQWRNRCRHLEAARIARASLAPKPATVTPITPKAVNGGWCVECDAERQMPGSTRCPFCHERHERQVVQGVVR